jgi:nicotinate-nucleotide adenylyltransferase
MGHLRGAEEIREVCGLREVVFIPSSIPPHKEMGEIVEARHRLEMVKLATATNPHFSVSTVETERPEKSYSIDTIRYFRETSSHPLTFILGRDAFVEIETWREFQSLFFLCDFIVMARPGFAKTLCDGQLPKALASAFRYDEEAGWWIHTSGHTLRFQEIAFLDISSTRIRQLIERGKSVKYLVPGEVEAYIQRHGLYRKGT